MYIDTHNTADKQRQQVTLGSTVPPLVDVIFLKTGALAALAEVKRGRKEGTNSLTPS